MPKGTIKSLVKERGFGFIQVAGGREDIFFHRSALKDGGNFDNLIVGESVQFETEPNARDGRPQAVSVKVGS